MTIKDEMQKSVEEFVVTVSDLAKRMTIDTLNSALGGKVAGVIQVDDAISTKKELKNLSKLYMSALKGKRKTAKKVTKAIVKRVKKAVKAHIKKKTHIAKSEKPTVWIRKAGKPGEVVATLPEQMSEEVAA